MEGIKAESRLLTEELKGQITGVFQKLERKIQIIAILDPEEEKGKELGCFLMAIGTLHPMVEVSLYCCGENQELEQHFDPEMRPVSGIFLEDGNFTGAAFYGVPGGQELNSFIFAIYNAGSVGQAIEKRLIKKLEKLEKPVHFRTFVSLACHHCPKMVIDCQRLCMLSPWICADMVDASLYPEMQDRYQIQRVPMTLVNDEKVMGVKAIETLVELACTHGCEKKKRFGRF
ncbi:MAG: thioredoxin family protein [Anaerostipes sp.]|uniref:thioredoxin family protein n=1 Tax=Anaerostipes sp. 992a TaxID=1261637 RepID=UPI0009F8DA39|nr:thioredoxin family protein [Anaerostipes sp. 992a]MCI5951016.1 thioredoxin family protein [Anaerostipes sp.]MDD5968558.1 thioredoxin family protein [Anaerostipes sp.]